MPTLISAVDLHRKTGDLLARIRYKGECFIIERRGQPVAVLLGIEEFRQLEALAAQQRTAESAANFAALESALKATSPVEAEPLK